MVFVGLHIMLQGFRSGIDIYHSDHRWSCTLLVPDYHGLLLSRRNSVCHTKTEVLSSESFLYYAFCAATSNQSRKFRVTHFTCLGNICANFVHTPLGVIARRSSLLHLRRAKLPLQADPDTKKIAIETSVGMEKPRMVLGVSFSGAFKADALGIEIAVIALPAILALAADPLASLVDTAFIGQIGPVELAAVGVSISIFNLVSKALNLPLLNITTSFVAEDNAADESAIKEVPLQIASDSSLEREQDISTQLLLDDELGEEKSSTLIQPLAGFEKRLLPSVSSALLLGSALGLSEAALLAFGGGPILSLMGVAPVSSMRVPAMQYLSLRAIGAPAVVIALAIQGVFRGFKDTKTPLYATVAGNVANIVLDPIFMFVLGYGVSGAAIATVISQYLIVLLLLWRLNKQVILLPPKISELRFARYFKSGGLLVVRSMAILLTMTLATSMAARQGSTPMAAHQICMQIWLAASLLSDSLALAGQAIIADGLARTEFSRSKEATVRVLQIGAFFGVGMAITLGCSIGTLSKIFTSDAGVLAMISGIMPFVAATQPINSLAFVFDGAFYGASDFAYSAYSTIVIATLSSLCLLIAPSFLGLPGVWIGLTTLMILRMSAGFIRLGTATGPWFFLKEASEESQTRT